MPIASDDIPKSAVITPFGLFEYTSMTFGLRNAGQTFQRYINCALGDLSFAFAYIDDIFIASSNPEEHEKHLRVVFDRLKRFSLRINLAKCLFGKPELKFLSYLINSDGCAPTHEKVRAIVEFPKPKTVVELRRFLGMVNYYRRAIPRAAEISSTRLVTDASNYSMGSSLEQLLDCDWKPVAFFSRKFSPPQRVYSTYDRELTAMYEAVRHFRYFLEDQNFTIVTDHKPLVHMFTQRSDKASVRQQRQV